MQKNRVSESPLTFTPATSSAAAALVLSPQEHCATMCPEASPSPTLEKVEKSELYKQAGWTGPVHFTTDPPRSSAERTERLESRSEVVPPTPFAEDEWQLGSVSTRSDQEAFSDGLPRTMAEIFAISNRNRTRNKEKKKIREGGGPLTLGDEAREAASETVEPPIDYFSCRDDQLFKGGDGGQVASDEAAVDFMATIGWVSEEKKGLLLSGDIDLLCGACDPAASQETAPRAGSE